MRVSAWLYLAQQLLCSLCLLVCIGLSAGQPRFSPVRLLVLCGALALLTLPLQTAPLPLRLLALPLSALMPQASWPDAPRHLRLHLAAAGLLLPLTLTGLLRLMASLQLPWYAALLMGCGGMLLLSRADRRGTPLPRCTCVEASLGMRRMTLTALVDSGNLLRDSVTGLPVIVISRRAAARLLRLPPEGALLPGMRLMPVRTISGVTLMTILRPDGLRIRVGGAWLSVEALIGLSPSGGEGFQALVPASLLPCVPAEIPRRAISQ